MADLRDRYATALFELLMENGALDVFLKQAAFLRDTLQDAECQRVINHPHISVAEKCEFFNNAFAEAIHNDLYGFLHLAIVKKHEKFLVPILTAFIDMADRYYRRTTANVTSAIELNEGQISALKELLSKKLNKHVEISLKVDPSVIGGLYIHVDGYFIVDQTMKKRLHDMKVNIKRSTANDSQA